MNRTLNSTIAGLFFAVCTMMAFSLGYILSPPVHELVHVSEPVHLTYFIDQALTIALAFTVQHNMSLEIRINDSVIHALDVWDAWHGTRTYGNFTFFTLVLDPDKSSYYFFDHAFGDDVCQVEYFLY